MSWQLCSVIDQSVSRCIEIARVPFHEAKPMWVSEAAFALLLINLKDALAATNRLGKRVSFSEDLTSGDITDAVVNMRNAICHNGSPLRMFDEANNNSLSFCLIIGSGTLLSYGDLKLGSPYDDDVAFFYGKQRLLLKRHIYRAIDELVPIRKELASKFDYHLWDRT